MMAIKGSENMPVTLDMLLEAKDQRIAELEAGLTAAQAARTKSHEEAADWRRLHGELLTELGPWRRMGEQLEALWGAGFDFSVKFEQPDGSIDVEAAMVLKSGMITRYGVGSCRKVGELPAAVAAAYGKAVGDE